MHDNHEHAVSDVATTVADVATARARLQVRDDSKTLINWPIAEWMRVGHTGKGTPCTIQKQLCQIPDVFNPVRFRFHHEKLCCGAAPRACGRSRCWRQGVCHALSRGRACVLRMPSSISAHGTLELMNQVRKCDGCCECGWSVNVNASKRPLHEACSPYPCTHTQQAVGMASA